MKSQLITVSGNRTREQGRLPRLVLAVPLCLLLGCNPSNNAFSPGKITSDGNGTEQKKAEEPKGADAEAVDIPNNITGAYLVCAQRKAATASDPTSDYGCRLNDAQTNQKLDITAIQSKIIWGSNLPDNVQVNQRSPIEAWHAIYTIKGTSSENIQDLSSRLSVQVQWTDTAASPPVTFKEQQMKEVLRPISTTGDTGAPILQQGIDPSDPATF